MKKLLPVLLTTCIFAIGCSDENKTEGTSFGTEDGSLSSDEEKKLPDTEGNVLNQLKPPSNDGAATSRNESGEDIGKSVLSFNGHFNNSPNNSTPWRITNNSLADGTLHYSTSEGRFTSGPGEQYFLAKFALYTSAKGLSYYYEKTAFSQFLETRREVSKAALNRSSQENSKFSENISSRKLGQNLEEAGFTRPRGPNGRRLPAHHIVPWDDPRAGEARRVLKRVGIGLDDPINGIFLPENNPSPFPGAPHRRIHTDEYFNEINRGLRGANTRAEVIDVMDEVWDRLAKNDTTLWGTPSSAVGPSRTISPTAKTPRLRTIVSTRTGRSASRGLSRTIPTAARPYLAHSFVVLDMILSGSMVYSDYQRYTNNEISGAYFGTSTALRTSGTILFSAATLVDTFAVTAAASSWSGPLVVAALVVVAADAANTYYNEREIEHIERLFSRLQKEDKYHLARKQLMNSLQSKD